MKSRLLAFIFLISVLGNRQVSAGDFRYEYWEDATGLDEVVYDSKGEKTTVVFSKDSNPEAMALFHAITSMRGVWGTQGVKKSRGASWEQGIVLTGDFTSPVKHTPHTKNGAGSELFRDFRVSNIHIVFPFARFVGVGPDGPDQPDILQIHFGFDTLLPKGVLFNGKKIDLEKHAVAPPE